MPSLHWLVLVQQAVVYKLGHSEALHRCLLVDPLLDVLSQELARADGLHHDGHEGVVCAAQLVALAIEHALAVDGQPDLVQTTRQGVDLHPQGWHGPTVDHV
eukprot:CAMPEP_0202867030 /NCGR_PEP_ID=MMETSP1391-20130828/8518_1 /ASSEMBLY_ACC=CAM_ASM_000867 /TAXON_ID=1034604 /ORGANISM="Chlamydomonas leiostraca, Strain SAG 11-49" /LENGTH=101 /DNA_ID=CAMNT_0049547029 /DNA_START=147 /DNA_END=453 /DNA_ORIENTATION=-